MLNCVPIQTFVEIGLRKFCFGCRIDPLLLYKTKEVSNFFICDRHRHFLKIPEQGRKAPDKCGCGNKGFRMASLKNPISLTLSTPRVVYICKWLCRKCYDIHMADEMEAWLDV